MLVKVTLTNDNWFGMDDKSGDRGLLSNTIIQMIPAALPPISI
jgi:hypothetical protein